MLLDELGMKRLKKNKNVIIEKVLLFLTKMRGLNILSLSFLTSAREVFSHILIYAL